MGTRLDHRTAIIEIAFEARQHKYIKLSEKGPDYAELLEIKNPPEGKCPFVIVTYIAGNCVFCELPLLDKAWDTFSRLTITKENHRRETILRNCDITNYHVIDNNLVKPWCYGNQLYPHGYFGKEKQFTTQEPYNERIFDELSSGVEHLLILPNRTITIDTPIGYYKNMTLWKSGEALAYDTIRAISSLEPRWQSSYLFSKWLSFIGSTGKKAIELAFPNAAGEITVNLDLSKILATELKLKISDKRGSEEKYFRATTYTKKADPLPKRLYNAEEMSNSIWKVLEYFMTNSIPSA